MELVGYKEAPYRFESPTKNFLEYLESDVIKKPLIVEWGGGKTTLRSEPYDKRDKFIIYDFATPNFDNKVRSMSHFYGVGGRQVRLSFDGSMVHPEDPEDSDVFKTQSYPYCEIDYMTLWSYTLLANFFSGTHIMDDLKYLYEGPVKSALKKTHFKTKEKRQKEKLEKGLVEALQKRTVDALGKSRSRIVMIEEEIASTHGQTVLQHKKLKAEADQLELKELAARRTEEQHARQINTLLANEEYTSVNLTNNGSMLEVKTEELYLYSPAKETRVPLGAFKLSLNLDNNNIIVRNMTGERGGRYHPHVPSSGTPCWGAMSTPVAKLAAEGEFVSLFAMITMYLETYSPVDDYGKFAQYWFKEDLIEYRQEDGTYSKEKPKVKTEDVKKEKDTVSATELGIEV